MTDLETAAAIFRAAHAAAEDSMGLIVALVDLRLPLSREFLDKAGANHKAAKLAEKALIAAALQAA